MKRLILFFVLFGSLIFAQAINTILVPGSTSATLSQSSSQFNTICTNMSYLNWTASGLSSQYSYSLLPSSIRPTAWGQDMLAVGANGTLYSRRPNSTAEEVRAYAIAYRFETDATKKTLYQSRATKGAEFLLWLMNAAGNDGGIPDLLDTARIATEIKGPHHTAAAGCAFYECYQSFGDTKYKTALEKTADWEIGHSCYPYEYYFPTSRSGEGTMKYYSRINHIGRALENLSNAYKIFGKRSYLDRAIQIAEEIIAWQSQDEVDDNPWPAGSITNDGSWWWENRDPNPLPTGAASSPDPGARVAAERKIDYHCLTLDGLVALLESTQQQVLPGTSTIRNGVSFISFRNNLISSIKRAVNYIVDNQETSTNTGSYRYAGLIKSYKLYKRFFTDTWTLVDGYYNSAPHGLFSIINSYLSLLRTSTISSQDSSNLVSLINSVSTSLINRNSFNWGWEETTPILLLDWAKMMNYKSLSSISSNLALLNAGFEGTTYDKDIKWELWSWDTTGVEISSTQKRTGNNSVHITDNNSGASKWASQLVTVTPNATYKAEAYAKIVSNYQALYIHYYDASYNLVDFNYTPIYANSSFQYVSVQKQAPSNAVYARITLYADWYGTSEGYWDDISFSVVSPKISEQVTSEEVPVEYSLGNYPNPFNPATKIQYSLKHASNTKLQVYDVTGREVAMLVNGFQEKGKHEVEFDASQLSSGIYFYSIQSGEFVQTKKMMLVK